MAALFEALAVTGHRKSTGAANASGLAWFYRPGTTNQATVYADADELETLTNPVTLDAGGKAAVYLVDAVEVAFEDSTGAPIETLTVGERADRVEVQNAGFTGLLPSGSQGAGGATDLDTVLSSLFTSFGGLDGKYKEFTGATARTIQSVIRGIQVSVKDYGAVGNGIADDTTAVQQAVNEVARLGGGRVWFDPGTYLISSAITATSVAGLTLVGAGMTASIIKASNASQNGLTLTSCPYVVVANLGLTHSGTSTGSAISVVSCASALIERVGVDTGGAAGTFLIAVETSGTASATVNRCQLVSRNAAGGRAVKLGGSGAQSAVLNTSITCFSSGRGIEMTGAGTEINIIGNAFASSSGKGILFNASFTGSRVSVLANPGLGALGSDAIDISALASDPKLVQRFNGVDGYTENVTSGGTVTPNRGRGAFVRYRGTTTGAAYVVAAPTPVPSTAAGATDGSMRDEELTIQFFNNASGAVTGWTLNAVYHTAGAISTTDLDKTTVTFRWDSDSSVWRETARAVSA